MGLDGNQLVVSEQAGNRFVCAFNREFDMNVFAADPRDDTRNHPVTEPDIDPVAGL